MPQTRRPIPCPIPPQQPSLPVQPTWMTLPHLARQEAIRLLALMVLDRLARGHSPGVRREDSHER
jgi:hypothetical protein